jgi:hypothetical protein
LRKLYHFKKHLALEEVAEELTDALLKPVSVADVLQLGLDKELPLSVFFAKNVKARPGKIVNYTDQDIAQMIKSGNYVEDLDWEDDIDAVHMAYTSNTPIDDPWPKAVSSQRLDETRWLTFREEKIVSVIGLCELAMIGTGLSVVHDRFKALTGRPAICGRNDGGIFVIGDGDTAYLLMELSDELPKPHIGRQNFDNYVHMDRLPNDAVLAVRPAALELVAARIAATAKPLASAGNLGTREKRTLLILIAALCQDIGIDWTEGGAAKQVEGCTEFLGVKVTDDTIKKYLDQIQDALDSRTGN